MTIYETLFQKVMKIYRKLIKIKLKCLEKKVVPGLVIRSSKLAIWTIHNLSEYNVWPNCLKFRDKMDLSIRNRRFNNSKHSHRICLKFGHLLLTTLITLIKHGDISMNQVSPWNKGHYLFCNQRKSTFILS